MKPFFSTTAYFAVTFYFAECFLFLTPIISEGGVDPLLRRPWIGEIREREIRSFHGIQSAIFAKQSFRVARDRWGRNFKLKKNGEMEYILDENYRQKFPDSDNLVLAYYEAKSLESNIRDREALHLLDGILYCYSIKYNRVDVTDREKEANDLANKIRNRNQDKKEFYVLNDPFGCYHEKSLQLSSSGFNYQIKIPMDWEWEYTRDPEEVTKETKEYNARFLRFYKILVHKKDKTWEEEKLLSEIGENKFRKTKKILFLGALKENQPIFQKENFYKVWDGLRGIQKSTKREWQITRKEKSPGYEMQFPLVNEKGEKETWTVREYYYWKRGQGIFLSFSYPTRESETMEREWAGIVESLRVRE